MPISLSGSLNLSGSLTTTGTITATTLVVQTITSSISSITGSTNFGSLVTDTHKFTGSLNVTGALYIATGSVGIGTVSPSQLFEVVGGEIKAGRVDSSNEGGQVSFGRSTDNATAWYIDAYGNVASPQLRFVNVSNAVVAMTITGSNVGIAISSPIAKLHVETSTATDGIYLSRSTSNKQTILLSADDGVGAYIAGNTTPAGNASATDGAGRLILQGGSTEGFQFQTSYVTGGTAASWTTRMRITNAGQLIAYYGQTGGYNRTDSGYVNETINITANCTAYFFYKYSGGGNGSSSTNFNITGVSTTNGTWLDVCIRARKDATASAINTTAVFQINGSTIDSNVANGTGAMQRDKTLRVVRMSDEWIVVGTPYTV